MPSNRVRYLQAIAGLQSKAETPGRFAGLPWDEAVSRAPHVPRFAADAGPPGWSTSVPDQLPEKYNPALAANARCPLKSALPGERAGPSTQGR